MDAAAGGADTSNAQINGGDPQSSKAILMQIDAYETQYQGWQQRGKAIIERYKDARLGQSMGPLNPMVVRKFNILWSNVETLKPTLYARLPQMVVEREYKDKDPVARVACEIAERAGNYTLRKSGFDQVLRQCVHDRLLPGRAVAWVDYQVEGEQQPVVDPMTGQPAIDPMTGQPQMQFVKRSEKVVPKYCDWRDFGHSPVRLWTEVEYAWYRIYTTEDENKQQFPQFYGDGLTGVPLDRKPEDDKDKVDTVIPQSTIYVVYCKKDRVIRYIHKDLDTVLREQPPPVDFEDFWPWPRPLYATMTNESLQPVPDFYYYQDQADELDKITNRLARVMDAMKVTGVYDKNEGALQRLFHPNGAPDNLLSPVDNWQAFAEKGGFKGAFQLAPLEELGNTANMLTAQRDQVLQVIYQVTGIADIIRGASDPNETATAQGIKSQFASLRIKDTQAEVARFARDLGSMIVETIVENFEPKTIWEMTNAAAFCIDPQTQQPSEQLFTAALSMLRNQKLRDFQIDIETDSTIQLDDAAEKASAGEFIQACAQFIQAWGPVVQQQPLMYPMISEMLMFLVRRYRAGRSLEGIIEQTMEQLKAASQQQQKPDPEMQKAQAQMQIEQQKAQTQLQMKQQQAQLDAQLEREKAQRQAAQEQQQAQADMTVQQQKAQLDMQLAREKAALDAELARQQAELDAALKVKMAMRPANAPGVM
ncbi:hypothetical protein UFOVP1169_15 [uncultured Caudovirales phage]|uniref:Phage P22-like portal protein n=1 Tax=uncultured Caudovirales phage TaxID=2100421 RepID=A0A6J5QZ38_9CAUD|nr:hypothetical protein UFOVP1169_15 [uncultured Caudovirales phage]